MAQRHMVALALSAAMFATMTPSAISAASKSYTVTIDNMKFGPVPSNLRVGDTIIWVNHDIFRHSATATDKSFDVDLLPSKSARLVLKRPGAIAFFCKYHPGMRGQIIVKK